MFTRVTAGIMYTRSRLRQVDDIQRSDRAAERLPPRFNAPVDIVL